MKSGLYVVETIDERTALLSSLNERKEQFTFKVEDFRHDVSVGDVVKIWREGDEWETKYLEEKTKSASSHAKDFVKRILEQE